MQHIVYLGLGANIGDRIENLMNALKALPPLVQLLECSPIYETAPWGFSDQPSFLNQVVEANTELSPGDLLSHLKRIEVRLGRKPTIKYGPRLIDIDILFYDDLTIKTDVLEIPHPLIDERAFVLLPLADIAPEFKHPLLNSSIRQLVAEVDTSGVRWYASGECGTINRN